jgi:IclR family acetate operon transcriptional repressor
MARTGQPSQQRVTAVGRSFAILDALADGGELGTNELARRIGTTPSTVSRQLGSLVQARLVDRVAQNGRYRLGIRVVELANAVLTRLDVRVVARPHLEALVEEVDETATLSVPAEPDAITVDFVPTQRFVQGTTRLGRPSIGHATAAGKVMLAFAHFSARAPLAAYTPRTITEPAELEAELARVRKRGWADAFEEREPELNAIAAPIWASRGELAGIVALQGPIPRFGRASARRALPVLLEHADAISRELGFRGSM